MITVTNERQALEQIENAMRKLRPSRRWCFSLKALCLSLEKQFDAVGTPVDSEVGFCVEIELVRIPLVTVLLRIDEKEEPIFYEDGEIEDFAGQWVFTAVSFACSEDHFWEEIIK